MGMYIWRRVVNVSVRICEWPQNWDESLPRLFGKVCHLRASVCIRVRPFLYLCICKRCIRICACICICRQCARRKNDCKFTLTLQQKQFASMELDIVCHPVDAQPHLWVIYAHVTLYCIACVIFTTAKCPRHTHTFASCPAAYPDATARRSPFTPFATAAIVSLLLFLYSIAPSAFAIKMQCII